MENEINFMKLYVALLYQNGYCYFDVEKDVLDEYLLYLNRAMEINDLFNKYKNLEKIFEYNKSLENYNNFINLILYVTSEPKYSFINRKSNIIMINLNRYEIEKILNEKNNININLVDNVVDYMINYLNLKIKMKIK